MMNLYIIRHAESANNRIAQQVDYDTFVATRASDPPITELGFAQANLLATHLASSEYPEFSRTAVKADRNGYGITRLYCSPMRRALQTAYPLSQALGAPLAVWVDTHEQGGLFQGDPRTGEGLRGFPGMGRSAICEEFPGIHLPDEMTEEGWWPGHYEDRPECDERAERVAQRLRSLAAVEPHMRIAMISHGTFIDHLLKRLLGIPPGQHMYFSHANTGITRIEFTADDFVVLRYLNRFYHLPPSMVSR
jgi:broad specificity phosphatase PhoE